MKLYGIIGSGGFGREVMPLAKTMIKKLNHLENYKLVFVTEEKNTPYINDYEVYSIDEFLNHPAPHKYFNIAIANFQNRKRLAELMIQENVKPFRINAANFIELDNNFIEDSAIFCPFTTVTSNTKIGKFFHANIYSYIAHDCIIGDYVTFAPNVHCNGNILIEDYAYIGTGAFIREGTPDNPIIIGKGAIIGMGAVVTKSVPPETTVIGNPAKPLLRKSTMA